MPPLRELIDALAPDGGWWKSGTGQTLQDAGTQLETLGVPHEAIIDVLGSVIGAVGQEYGD